MPKRMTWKEEKRGPERKEIRRAALSDAQAARQPPLPGRSDTGIPPERQGGRRTSPQTVETARPYLGMAANTRSGYAGRWVTRAPQAL